MKPGEGSGGSGCRRLGRVATSHVLACLLTATLVAGCSPAVGEAVARPAASKTSPSPSASPPPPPSPSPTDQLAAAKAITSPAAPARLLVPAIGVQAAVEAVDLDAQGRMANPSRAENVAWFHPGVVPGDAGNAVIAGHLDWTTGPAVFWQLAKLKRGDQVTVIRLDGSQARFTVDSTTTMPYNAATDGLFTRGGLPSLTLITCAGAWDRQRATYLQRLVVRTLLAAIVAASPQPGG